jgi:hypothetical protein
VLTQEAVVSYLMDRRLLSMKHVVDGDLIVIDSSRRNRNFKVISEQGPSYFVKQGIGPEGAATVSNEAAAYERFNTDPEGTGLKSFLPRFYGYDADERVLVLELVRTAEDLREYHIRRSRFSTSLAARLGQALAGLHQLAQSSATPLPNSEIGFPCQLPWVLTIHQPNQQIFRDISSANLQVLRIVQQFPEFCTLLDSLRQKWSVDHLIHFDIKWDNCITVSQPSKSAKDLRIIDWELTSLGDSCWDVGAIFNDYLSFWLLSIPVTGDVPPDQFPQLARYPLERMQPAMRAFWSSYVCHMGLNNATADAWLLRSTELAAARVLQTAFEQMQMSAQITGTTVLFLQLSFNMLRRPYEALVHLLGIPLNPREWGGSR